MPLGPCPGCHIGNFDPFICTIVLKKLSMKMSLTLWRADTKFNIKAQASETREKVEKLNSEISI